MKIERHLKTKTSIEKFAKENKLTMEIHERHTRNTNDRFYAYFKDCEEMQNGMLASTFANGATEKEAIKNYAERISGKRLAFKAYTKDRFELEVPCLI